MNQRILLDLDDVTVDLSSAWLLWHNSTYEPTTAEVMFQDWEIHKHVECGMKVYDILHSPGFFYSLKPKDGAIEAVKVLRHFFDITIVTSITRSHEAAKDKVLWIKKYMPFYDIADLVMTKRKELVRGDIMIDDCVENLNKWQKANPEGVSILFHAEHNKKHRQDFDFSVPSWDALMPILSFLHKR